MKAEELMTNIANFFSQVDVIEQKQGGHKAFESSDGEGSLYSVEDPLDKHNLTLENLHDYAFVQFEQEPIRTFVGQISRIYGRNHQMLTEDRKDNEFPYDFLLIIEAPFPIRIWCEDFSDFVAVMKELKSLII